MFLKKPTIPLILVFITGLVGFGIQYVPHWRAEQFQGHQSKWFIIIGAFAVFISMYSLLHMHSTRIRRKVPGWGYSIFMFAGFVFMIAAGMWNGGAGPLGQAPVKAAEWYRQNWREWGFKYIQTPAQATIFSILAFFMASAAFRTFRARNLAAALLLMAAIVVMFGRVPVSEWVAGQTFPKAVDVLMEYPNVAAQRGILFGVCLGGIAQSLRILFGIERSYLGAGN